MSHVLQTLYASAPVDDVIIHTLELSHPAFSVPGHPAGLIRLAQGFDDINVILEDASTATFKASGFGVSLPQKSVNGRQDLTFKLDNVTGEAIQSIDAAQEAGGRIAVTYRAYAGSDLSQPGQPPVVMTAISATADYSSISINASFHDLVNKAWPFRRYTPDFAPGLKYYG
ncbi:MAG: DUF1833 family protein [Gammaproteobacteria bacterium]|nr:DUF1833 family protein [Gammaproteobacteria bacterium]